MVSTSSFGQFSVQSKPNGALKLTVMFFSCGKRNQLSSTHVNCDCRNSCRNSSNDSRADSVFKQSEEAKRDWMFILNRNPTILIQSLKASRYAADEKGRSNRV